MRTHTCRCTCKGPACACAPAPRHRARQHQPTILCCCTCAPGRPEVHTRQRCHCRPPPLLLPLRPCPAERCDPAARGQRPGPRGGGGGAAGGRRPAGRRRQGGHMVPINVTNQVGSRPCPDPARRGCAVHCGGDGTCASTCVCGGRLIGPMCRRTTCRSTLRCAVLWRAVQDGFTPLYVACARSHLEVVQLLVAARAGVDAPDKVRQAEAGQGGAPGVCCALAQPSALFPLHLPRHVAHGSCSIQLKDWLLAVPMGVHAATMHCRLQC